MTAETPRITALTPAQAAKILAAAGNRRITEAMVRAPVAEWVRGCIAPWRLGDS